MANKFGFGDLSFKLKAGVGFAGRQHELFGERLIAGGYFEDMDYEYGFGEIVEVVGNIGINYVVKPIDATTLATAQLAVIMNEITGASTIHGGTIQKGISQVPLNLWLLTRDTHGSVFVPVVEDEGTPIEIGDTVYIGTGTNDTIAGSAYSSNVTGTLEVEGLLFRSKSGKPTATNGKTVAIGTNL